MVKLDMQQNWMRIVQCEAIVVTVLLALVLTGCRSERDVEQTRVGDATPVTNQLSEDEEIYRAVLQNLLYGDLKDYWGDASEKRFVEVAGANPSDALLARFSEYEHSLHKASGCDDTFDGVFDNETGEPAILYKIHAPKKIDEEKVEV